MCSNKYNDNVLMCFLVCSPGLYELTIDNKTVSGETINIVERLSLYPELITSFVYRITSSQVKVSLSLCDQLASS